MKLAHLAASAAAFCGSAAAAPPDALRLHWSAPWLSGGGYASEALSFATGAARLSPPLSLSGRQHGDSVSPAYVDDLPDADLRVLDAVLRARIDPQRAISVCHSEPGAWHLSSALPQRYSTALCPLPGAAYRVGRTMFETDRLPSGWAERLNAMDEVWVPSDWAAQVFAAGGVAREKLVVLGEAVDAGFFRPLGRVELAAAHAAVVGQGSGGSSSRLQASRSLLLPELRPATCSTMLQPLRVSAGEAEGVASGGAAAAIGPVEAAGASASCPFRFLAVGKWERRKNFEALLRAYLTEFRSRGQGKGQGQGGNTQAAAAAAAAADTGVVGGHSESSFPPPPPPLPAVELYILTSAYHSSRDFEAQVERLIATELRCADGQDGHEEGESEEAAEVAVAVDVEGSASVKAWQHTRRRCLPASAAQASSASLPPVYLLTGVPGTAMPALYSSVDAFVLPSRGEGWGRPHVEAMASGLPVLATNWSGTTAFLSEETGYPVPWTHLAPIPDGAFAGHLQAEVDVDALARLMREVASDPDAARARGAAARAAMQTRFSPELLAQELAGHVRRIQEKVASASGAR